MEEIKQNEIPSEYLYLIMEQGMLHSVSEVCQAVLAGRKKNTKSINRTNADYLPPIFEKQGKAYQSARDILLEE